jgi:hypothetical protein
MKRSLYSPPEPFSLSPLLALVPTVGKVGKLEALTSSLYARYEKVTSLQRELAPISASSEEREILKKFAAEEQMLTQVLDWLAVKPESAK